LRSCPFLVPKSLIGPLALRTKPVYVSAGRAAASATEQAGAVETWARWALAEADRLDPIADGRMLASIWEDDKP